MANNLKLTTTFTLTALCLLYLLLMVRDGVYCPISPISTSSKSQQETWLPSSETHVKSSPDINETLRISQAANNFLLSHKKLKLNTSLPIEANISRILDNDGQDLRTSREIIEPEMISLNTSKRAWQIIHNNLKSSVRDRLDLIKPSLMEILQEAKVSFECLRSITFLLDKAEYLDNWAIKILNSWSSFPPNDLFDGTYTEMGSYHTCTSVLPKQPYLDHAHYCTITFRPIMPTRKDYQLVIEKEPEELIKMFNESDILTDYLATAQYHNYLYYKLGTCWPIECSPFDIKKVVKLVGRRNILANGPIKCYSMIKSDYEAVPVYSELNSTNITSTKKLHVSVWDLNNGIYVWKPHFYTIHLVAYALIIILTIFIFTMTAIDIILNRIPSIMNLYSSFVENKKKINQNNQNNCLVKNKNNNNNIIQTTFHNNFSQQFEQINLNNCKLNSNNNSLCHLEASNNNDNKNNNNNNNILHQIDLNDDYSKNEDRSNGMKKSKKICLREKREQMSTFMAIVDDCSIITSAKTFFAVKQSQSKNEIMCLNGLRSVTMLWVVTAHSMMYNDWSAFARTKEIEKSLSSLITQPIFNGTYVVDTFFFMSGLLSSYTAFRHSNGKLSRFSSVGLISARWLRLTPQLLFVSMMYIVLPTWMSGPHWYPVAGEFSENCMENWWVNLFHIQAFYRKDKMCNFVTWWISIDYLYHFIAIVVIWLSLRYKHLTGFLSIVTILLVSVSYEAFRHYKLKLPPNFLSTLPQTGIIWTQFVLQFFWQPYSHAVPFFFGFYSGYLLALKRKLLQRHLNPRKALIGWTLCLFALPMTSYSTHWWVVGKFGWIASVSTAFYVITPIIWAGCLSWIVISCHNGYGGIINRILCWRAFVIGGKASYLIYLTHFQVLIVFFGSTNILMEPTELVMFYIVLGNVVLSTCLGIGLCIIYEIPWLKAQGAIVRKFISPRK